MRIECYILPVRGTPYTVYVSHMSIHRRPPSPARTYVDDPPATATHPQSPMDAAAPAPPASPPLAVHLVTGGRSSPEHALLLRSLAAARVVALDAEWKPRRRGPAVADDPSAAAAATPPPPQFPTVTLLQVACRGDGDGGGAAAAEVFVVDLLAVPLAELREPLRELFERPEVLKLGFRFKQDLVYLSATFAAALGSSAGFERVSGDRSNCCCGTRLEPCLLLHVIWTL